MCVKPFHPVGRSNRNHKMLWVIITAAISISCVNRQKPPPIEIRSSDLNKEYKNNIVKADYQFTNKLLSVTGKVLNIERYPEAIVVHLRADDSPNYVSLVFKNNRFEDVVPLSRDGEAVIKGTCRGLDPKDHVVVLEDCFVSDTPVPKPPSREKLPPVRQ